MHHATSFLVSFGVTLTLLVAVVLTGRAARRRVHLSLVMTTVAMLALTIWFAERLGEHFDLEAAGAIFPLHLKLAWATVLAYLLPVVSGLATLRDARFRKLHGRIAWLVLGLTVATAATGTLMVLWAEPLES